MINFISISSIAFILNKFEAIAKGDAASIPEFRDVCIGNA